MRLSHTLSIPVVQSNYEHLTYDELLLKLSGANDPWIPLHNATSKDPVCVQLLFPLQGLLSNEWMDPAPDNYVEWKSWMSSRLRAVYDNLLRELPISANHGRHINPLVANSIVSAHFACTPYSHLIPHLLLRTFPVDDLLDAGVTLRSHFWRHSQHVLCFVAGLKYIKFSNYTYSPHDPCLFAKDATPYAYTYYAKTTAELFELANTFPDDVTVTMHIDNPSYGPHLLVPTRNVLGASGNALYECADWQLCETSLDQAISNHLSSNRRPVPRRIQSLLVLRSPYFSSTDTTGYGLICFSNATVCGHQMAFQLTKRPLCSEVSTLMSQLSDVSKPITTPLPLPRWFVQYVNVKLSYPDDVASVIKFAGPTFSGSSGTLTYTKDVPKSIPWQPQYDVGTLFGLDESVDDLWASVTLPLKPGYSDAWIGDPFHTSAICYNSDLSYPLDVLPTFPVDYFSSRHQNSRSKFSSYRKIMDRSLAKDKANLAYVSGLSRADGSPYVKDGATAAYLGASGTHPDGQPTIITPWLKGELPQVFKPVSVKQFGWEVTRGVIANVELPLATGTFSFVYSDVDQVQEDSDDLSRSDLHFIKQVDSIITLLSVGGTVIVKCNFPTRMIFRHIFSVVSSQFEAIAFSKPLIANNLEIYVCLLNKLFQSGPVFGPSTSVVRFMRQQWSRYQALVDAFELVPYRDSSVTRFDDVSMLSINFVDSASLTNVRDIRALSMFSLLGHLPTMQLATHPYFDSYRTNLSALVTPDSRNLTLRLRHVPRVFPSTINVQTRSIAATPPVLFGYKASHWTLLSMFYDSIVQNCDFNGGLWMDLGTGPECRIMSKLPYNQPLVMVDTRPPVYPMTCWNIHTEFLQVDYVLNDIISMRSPYVISAILTLGAAAADSGLALLSILDTLIDQSHASGATKLILQLNCPLDDHLNVPSDVLVMNKTRKRYHFPELGREEPYLTVDEVLTSIRSKYPDAVIEIRCADYDLSWLVSPFSNGVGTSSKSLALALQLSRCCPLFIVHTDIPAATFSPSPVVGTELSVTVDNFDVTSTYVLSQNDVEVLRYDASGLHSILNGATATTHGSALVFKLITTDAGLLELHKINGSKVPLGSVMVQAPDPSLTVVWPTVVDPSENGTNVELYVNDWYTLRLFAERDEILLPVSDDKYEFRLNSMWFDQRVLNIIVDRSDAFYKFFLMDVQSGAPGVYIKHQIHELSVPVWPAHQPSFLSPPSDDDFVVTTDDGPIPLYRPFDQIPSTWFKSDVSFGVDPSLPTFLVPPGNYGIVKV
uniref:Lambda C capping enzyme n=1 Tax=Cataraqui virus TaxID=2776967 RepID=A0A8E4VR02_9REOV|nr:MAG: lambda C capping enzyme [Cataraqui virus]QPB10694.1 MAG: lambda C capping enzyme [Cataraqui virus]